MFECFLIVVLKCEVLIWIFYKFFIRALFRKIFSHTFFGQLWHWSVRMCVCWDIPGCVRVCGCGYMLNVWNTSVWLLKASTHYAWVLGPGSWLLHLPQDPLCRNPSPFSPWPQSKFAYTPTHTGRVWFGIHFQFKFMQWLK